MSVWKNETENALSFEVRGKRHKVERDEYFTCEDRFDYAIVEMKLPLSLVDGPAPIRSAPKTLAEAIAMQLDGDRPALDVLGADDLVVFKRLGHEVQAAIVSAVEAERGSSEEMRTRLAHLEGEAVETARALGESSAKVAAQAVRITSLEAELAAANDLLAGVSKAPTTETPKEPSVAPEVTPPADAPADGKPKRR